MSQLMGVGSEEAEAAAGSPAGAAGTAGASMWRSVLTQQQRASAKDELGATAGVTGLSNEAGEFNCFVNVVIQCLWRCEGFRQQVSDPHLRGAQDAAREIVRSMACCCCCRWWWRGSAFSFFFLAHLGCCHSSGHVCTKCPVLALRPKSVFLSS